MRRDRPDIPRIPAELANDGHEPRVLCPFCGAYHLHGAGDPNNSEKYTLNGGRVSHCHRGGYVMVPTRSGKR